MTPKMRIKHHGSQEGATAIEFAVIFPLMLFIFYAIICYALILLHKQTLVTIAGEAARSAVAVMDENKIEGEIQKAIDGHAWISGRVSPCDGSATYYESPITNGMINLCLQAELPNDPPLPTIDLSFFGLPTLPPASSNLLRSELTIAWAP